VLLATLDPADHSDSGLWCWPLAWPSPGSHSAGRVAADRRQHCAARHFAQCRWPGGYHRHPLRAAAAGQRLNLFPQCGWRALYFRQDKPRAAGAYDINFSGVVDAYTLPALR